jgi:signal transduction histidine kinase
MIRGLYLDHAGRLWMASSRGGGARVNDPTAARPHFIRYTRRAQGLSSDDTHSLTEDRWGRVYIATGRGVDRLDPATGRLQHYTTAHGLPEGLVAIAFRDRQGTLWFGTLHGLARLIPESERVEPPPTALIRRLRIAGLSHPVSELGESAVSGLRLEAHQNSVQIDYVGLSWNPGEALRYQYRMEGTGEDWSPPTDQRTHYARLSPGSYRFAVRAVSTQGLVSLTPAVVSFTIRPPVWQRWWFLTLAALLVASVAYAFYRNRLARMIELERVRTRIATDLHDDIGSSLSHMAILSEVASRRVGQDDPDAKDVLSQIAGVSRELVDSMSDIVWAINPSKDRLSDLSKRMRRFAGEVLPANNIDFRLHTPEEDVPLGADLRRHLFLIFKESVHNLVRHARCTRAEIDLRREGSLLILKISDNGGGFDPASEYDGDGLVSMRQRAQGLGGQLEMVSQAGHGTTVRLRLRLDHPPTERV